MTMPQPNSFPEHPHYAPLNTPKLRDGLFLLAALVHVDEPVGSLTPTFAELVASSMGADYVEILQHVPHRHHFEIRASCVQPPNGAANAAPVTGEVPDELGSQAGYTLLRNKPIIVADAARETRFDHCQRLNDLGVQSGVTVPVPPDSARFGVLGAYSLVPRVHDDEEISFLMQASRYLAGVLTRYREAQTRRAAEQSLRLMEEAILRAASALDERIALQSLARLFSTPREGLSDVCLIDMEDSADRLYRAAAAANGGLLADATRQSRALMYPQEPDCPHGPPVVLSTGQPDIIHTVTREHLEILARDEAHLAALEDLAPTSYMCVPIKIRRHTLGGLVLMSRTRLYTDRDAAHAARLGSIVGLAVAAIRARMTVLDDARTNVGPYLPADRRVHPPKAIAPPRATDQSHGGDSETPEEDPKTTLPLPGRKGFALRLMLQGIPYEEIAARMGTSLNAIYKHEYTLRKYFDVETKEQVLHKARLLGYSP